MGWWSLGMGIGKIVLLKDLLPYRNKQVRKIKELEALVDGNGIGPSKANTKAKGHRDTQAPVYCSVCDAYLCECENIRGAGKKRGRFAKTARLAVVSAKLNRSPMFESSIELESLPGTESAP